ncbi:MAG: hypothetical protein NXI20_02780 [bacterium]|nr:hypothetical protein [bacterium]
MKIKKAILAIVFAGISSLAFSQTSILITNDTGIDFFGVHASESEDPYWSDDLLTYDIFEDESEVEITFPAGMSCLVDIMVTYDEESSIEFEEVDICEISGIILHYDGTYEIY